VNFFKKGTCRISSHESLNFNAAQRNQNEAFFDNTHSNENKNNNGRHTVAIVKQ
jgi:hypothetical protein